MNRLRAIPGDCGDEYRRAAVPYRIGRPEPPSARVPVAVSGAYG